MISKPEKKFLIKYTICRLIGLFVSMLYLYNLDNLNYLDVSIMIITPFSVYQLLDGFAILSFRTSITLLAYKYIFWGYEMGLYSFFIFLFIILFIIIFDEMTNKDTLINIYELIKREIKGVDINE